MEIKTSLEIENLMSSDNLKWRNNNYTKKWVAIDDVNKTIDEWYTKMFEDGFKDKLFISRVVQLKDKFKHITKSNSKDSKVKDKENIE